MNGKLKLKNYFKSRNKFQAKVLPFLLFSIVISLIIAFRDSTIGSDSIRYIDRYQNYLDYDLNLGRNEPGIYIFMFISKMLGGSYELFFFLNAFFITILSFYSIKNFISKNNYLNSSYLLIFFAAALMLSKWYFVATTNSLRQGVSAFLIIYSFSLFYTNRKFSGVFAYLSSILFHISSLLVMPFFILFLLNLRLLLVFFLFSSVVLVSGFSEIFIENISNFTGIPLYEFLYFYAGSTKDLGVQLNYLIYTLFWPVFFLALNHRLFSVNPLNKMKIFLIKSYLVLSMPYFYFSFGPYSTRYSFFAWCLLPIISSVFIYDLRISTYQKSLISIILLFIMVIYSLFYYLRLF